MTCGVRVKLVVHLSELLAPPMVTTCVGRLWPAPSSSTRSLIASSQFEVLITGQEAGILLLQPSKRPTRLIAFHV